jgi:hypothetical protein
MANQYSEAYSRYESALAALTSIPAQLAKDLDQAERNRNRELTAVESDARAEAERFAKLRRTVSSRYETMAKTLKENGVFVPTQLRPEPNQAGDAASLGTALKAQSTAEADVEATLRAARASAEREKAADVGRRAAGQKATEALKRRQEQVRRARDEAAAEEERKLRAAEARARRRKLLIFAGVAVMVTAVVIATILWLNH